MYDLKLTNNKGIEEGSLVLLFDSRHQDFPGKLHRQWMGPYVVHTVFANGSLQLKDLQGNLLETRTNGSRVKLYRDNENLSDDLKESASAHEDARV